MNNIKTINFTIYWSLDGIEQEPVHFQYFDEFAFKCRELRMIYEKPDWRTIGYVDIVHGGYYYYELFTRLD